MDDLGDRCKTLPPLRNATSIVVAGHSGGADGLIQNLDLIEGFLRTDVLGSYPTKVVGVIDARMWPALDTEHAFYSGIFDASGHDSFDLDQSGTVTLDEAKSSPFDTYNHNSALPVHNSGDLPPGDSGAGTSRSANEYKSHGGAWEHLGEIRKPGVYRNGSPDASCLADPPNLSWRCYDTSHVLLNHISTPIFVRQALMDSKHTGKGPLWADDSDYDWVQQRYTARVFYQLEAFLQQAASDADEASGYAYDKGIFAPSQTSHPRIVNAGQFFDVELKECDNSTGAELRRVNYHDALFMWVTYGTPTAAIEGRSDGTTTWVDAASPNC